MTTKKKATTPVRSTDASPSTRRSRAAAREASTHASHLSLDALCGVGCVSAAWLRERVEAGLIPVGEAEGEWLFEARTLIRVRTMQTMERDFDAAPELAALVADLREEIDALRRRLARSALLSRD